MPRKLHASLLVLASAGSVIIGGNTVEFGDVIIARYKGIEAQQIELDRRSGYDPVLYRAFKPGRLVGNYVYDKLFE